VGYRSGVQRVAVVRQPANFDLLARFQTDLIRRVPCLDDKFIVACNPQTGAENVTHVNELEHLSLQGMNPLGKTVLIVFDALWANGNTCPLARFADIHGPTIDQLTAIQLHQRDAVVDLFDHALERVVLANELRNKTILWFFIQLVWRCQLLNTAILKDRNTVRHGQGFGLVMSHIDNSNPEAVRQVARQYLNGREIRVAAKVQSAASYEAANIIALANAADRFDVDTGDPEAKIDQALNGVLIFRPNTCVMSESVWQKLRKQTKLVQAIKGTTQGDGKVTREEFARYFELQNVLIGAGYVNTARKGQPVNMQRVWGKHIAFTYLDRSIQRTDEGGVTWGFSPTFGTRVAGDMVDPNIGLKGGRVIRVGEQINELVVCKAAGALIQNAIS